MRYQVLLVHVQEGRPKGKEDPDRNPGSASGTAPSNVCSLLSEATNGRTSTFPPAPRMMGHSLAISTASSTDSALTMIYPLINSLTSVYGPSETNLSGPTHLDPF